MKTLCYRREKADCQKQLDDNEWHHTVEEDYPVLRPLADVRHARVFGKYRRRSSFGDWRVPGPLKSVFVHVFTFEVVWREKKPEPCVLREKNRKAFLLNLES